MSSLQSKLVDGSSSLFLAENAKKRSIYLNPLQLDSKPKLMEVVRALNGMIYQQVEERSGYKLLEVNQKPVQGESKKLVCGWPSYGTHSFNKIH